MADGYVCWRCGASLADLPMPLARLAECAACRADLHVCRLCEFYDKRSAKACREPVAEEVQDKQRANFCGYFQIRAGAHRTEDDSVSQSARAQLEDLFSGSPGGTTEANEKTGSRSAAEDARERLEQLFGGKGEI
jgi:hypothetical protein